MTARIGKELLSNNQKLEATVANLESELKTANETITQLQHELIKKNELIQILTNDVDESSSEPGKFVRSDHLRVAKFFFRFFFSSSKRSRFISRNCSRPDWTDPLLRQIFL